MNTYNSFNELAAGQTTLHSDMSVFNTVQTINGTQTANVVTENISKEWIMLRQKERVQKADAVIESITKLKDKTFAQLLDEFDDKASHECGEYARKSLDNTIGHLKEMMNAQQRHFLHAMQDTDEEVSTAWQKRWLNWVHGKK